jgi:hypothetical protein
VIGAVPDAQPWAGAAVALLAARDIGRTDLPAALARRIDAIAGASTARAGSLPAFAAALPRRASWVFAGDGGPDDLWRAEADWWHRLDRDGQGLLTRHRFGAPVVVGAIAVLAADAWRTRAALACAARGGAVEVFDEIA